MRPSCLNCVRKHLAQASILATEAVQGYPEHKWLAIGHLAEASEEAIDKWPGLAAEILFKRKAYETEDQPFRIIKLLEHVTEIDDGKM